MTKPVFEAKTTVIPATTPWERDTIITELIKDGRVVAKRVNSNGDHNQGEHHELINGTAKLRKIYYSSDTNKVTIKEA